ncbi:hypothetical protein PMAYCL1PPCAC_25689, partial [Pristionchus mayeri]
IPSQQLIALDVYSELYKSLALIFDIHIYQRNARKGMDTVQPTITATKPVLKPVELEVKPIELSGESSALNSSLFVNETPITEEPMDDETHNFVHEKDL